jgi:4-hydroxy-tetrahydrodipicolinate synthase
MRYDKKDAKAYARQHMRGIWAAALMPFTADLAIDEDGFRRNVVHWTEELGIDGLFIAGKQGEYFTMSVEERKRSFEMAVAACAGRGATIMSC